MMGALDPDASFDRLAGPGKDSVSRSELTNPYQQRMFDKAIADLGINSDKLTREQYRTYMRQRMEKLGVPDQSSGKPTTSIVLPPSKAVSPGGDQSGDQSDPNNAWAQMAERSFAKLDRNGDGVLNTDEMPEDLRADLRRWDRDGNGVIDPNEYKAYFIARMEQRSADYNSMAGQYASSPGLVAPAAPLAPPQPSRKLVYRTNNLPKELPPWFKQLDTNRDAQISLQEWRAAGKPIKEFLAMDRNNDGFLTVDEVLYYEAQKKKSGGAMGTGVVTLAPEGNGSPPVRATLDRPRRFGPRDR
jgi:Ca2+-binding EF-hand superfamily protein